MAKAIYVGVDSKARKMKKAYIGIGGKARKVKKMYIGDSSGKARLCYSAELDRHGMAAALSVARYDIRTATVGNYALFAGGLKPGLFSVKTVDAYNTSLTKSTPAEMPWERGYHASAAIGEYALFAGGEERTTSGSQFLWSTDVYNASLTLSRAPDLSDSGGALNMGAAVVGNYALFAGGMADGRGNASGTVNVYDTSLTHTMATDLTGIPREYVRGASVGNYALFAGGQQFEKKSNVLWEVFMVDAYDASLTKTAATNLNSNKNRDAAATVGNHAVFVGSPDSADIYDASLTRTSAAILSTARTGLAATTVGNYAIFSGGGVADFCDASLTRSSIDTSMTGYKMGAATIGDYALFAGGYSGGSDKAYDDSRVTAYDSVEVYTA